MRSLRAPIALASAFVACGTPCRAQLVQQRFQSEVRIDGLFASSAAVQAGFGVSIPAGIYLRTGLVGAAGTGSHGFETRADLLGRFSLDPFRQSRWGPYGGAGISGRFRADRAGGSHAYLLTYIGLEGPLTAGQLSGWAPAFELGLGGGTRVGVILRRGISGRR
jgi:hypothetical protein